jgi:predicted amino acid racemase
MFLRQIDELETFFKWLDRLNLIAYNVWNDKQRESYQNGHMVQMETLYRTYINDMRQISNELSLMQKQIAEAKEEAYRLESEISELKRQPEIEGCYSAYYVNKKGHQISDYFAVSREDVSMYGSDSTGVHLSNRL